MMHEIGAYCTNRRLLAFTTLCLVWCTVCGLGTFYSTSQYIALRDAVPASRVVGNHLLTAAHSDTTTIQNIHTQPEKSAQTMHENKINQSHIVPAVQRHPEKELSAHTYNITKLKNWITSNGVKADNKSNLMAIRSRNLNPKSNQKTNLTEIFQKSKSLATSTHKVQKKDGISSLKMLKDKINSLDAKDKAKYKISKTKDIQDWDVGNKILPNKQEEIKGPKFVVVKNGNGAHPKTANAMPKKEKLVASKLSYKAPQKSGTLKILKMKPKVDISNNTVKSKTKKKPKESIDLSKLIYSQSNEKAVPVKKAKIKIKYKVGFSNLAVDYLRNDTLVIIMPTYPRQIQRPLLNMQAQLLAQVPNIHILVAEDSAAPTQLVRDIMDEYKFNYTQVACTLPANCNGTSGPCLSKDKVSGRGAVSRNCALQWLQTSPIKGGILYFADDDNFYHLNLFKELRKTKKVALFPVGGFGTTWLSSVLLKDGKLVDFTDIWKGNRQWPIDMAGFSVSIGYWRKVGCPKFIFHAGYLETKFLGALKVTKDDIDILGEGATKVYVWHNSIRKDKCMKKKDYEKLQKLQKEKYDNIQELTKDIIPCAT